MEIEINEEFIKEILEKLKQDDILKEYYVLVKEEENEKDRTR